MVDVVGGDVGQVGGCGVFEYVELVDEVEEDGVLLARGGGLRGAEGALRYVVRCWYWGGEENGERGEGEGDEGGDVHGSWGELLVEEKWKMRCWQMRPRWSVLRM